MIISGSVLYQIQSYVSNKVLFLLELALTLCGQLPPNLDLSPNLDRSSTLGCNRKSSLSTVFGLRARGQSLCAICAVKDSSCEMKGLLEVP